MIETGRESAILAAQTRFKLYNLAKETWPECQGDTVELSQKLAKKMLESGIYLDKDSKLVDFTKEEHQDSKSKLDSGTKVTPGKWAVIDIESDEEMVVGGTSNPRLFRSEEEAKSFAMGMEIYQDWHEDCFDEDGLIIKWSATGFAFKHKGGDVFSFSDAEDDQAILDAGRERTKKLQGLIREIIDIEKIGDPGEIVQRGMFANAGELAQNIEIARRSKIGRRRDWINQHMGIRDESGKVTIKKAGKVPSGIIGRHKAPGIVKLAKQVDLGLASVLIELLDRKVPTIAEVLCRSHVWRTKQDELPEMKGKPRRSLLSQEDIGCRVGSDMGRVASDMIRWQFSIQPIFDSSGSQIGSLELNRITGLVGRGGWDALPSEVTEEGLSEAGLLGPMVPMVDPMERSDTVSKVLSTSIDAVIFRWDEARHSNRRGFPEECKGILEDGLHIVTSHDIMAYSMETGN